jgi:fructose-bisphosphate aldolase class 1
MMCLYKNILAADESQPTVARRFRAIGADATVENVEAAQQALLKRARLNGAAQRGEYLAAMVSANCPTA